MQMLSSSHRSSIFAYHLIGNSFNTSGHNFDFFFGTKKTKISAKMQELATSAAVAAVIPFPGRLPCRIHRAHFPF